MIPVIPWYISMIVVASAVAIAVVIWSILSSAASRSGLQPSAQRKVRIGTAVFFGGWLGAALLFAPAPSSLAARDPFYITPLIPLFFALSVTTSIAALWRSSSLRRVLSAVPLSTLHALQVWRVLGVVFVILLAQSQLPAHFALPAGWGDIAIGITAPLVAVADARRIRGATTAAVLWNVLGMLDLVVAVGMGTGFLAPLLAPGLGPQVPAAAAMGAFPMILVPAFAVPASVMVHVIALARLRREVQSGAGILPVVAHQGKQGQR
jgi:hypothetical protein